MGRGGQGGPVEIRPVFSCYLRIKYLMFQPPSARNNEKCANQIATNLAKKFGPGWNAVVGEAFSFEISYTKYVDIVLYVAL